MTSPTGAANNLRVRAFTLIELVIVMALLVTLAAIAVPSLSRSMRGHNLDGQADRLLALTEYARDEAVSQGIPMVMWIDVDGGRCGVDAKPGYGSGGENARAREYPLQDDAHFDPVGQGMVSSVPPTGTAAQGQTTGTANASGTHGGVVVAEFAPDGTLDPGSLPSVRVVDRAGDSLAVSQTSDAYGYEIVKGTR